MYRVMMVAAVAALTSPAISQEMPYYDVEAHCAQVAGAVGGSEAIRNACFRSEQRAYDELKPRWPEIPDQARTHCDSVARVSGPGTYSILSACIASEQRAAEENKTFTFQR